MAEVLGLVATVVGLVGKTASVSFTLFEIGRNLSDARKELDSLAADVSDLSNVLDHLVDVLKKYEAYMVDKTVRTVHRLVKRFELVMDELSIAADLGKAKYARIQWLFNKPKTLEHKSSLEGFKSNLNLVIQTLILASQMENEARESSKQAQRNVSARTERNINALRSAVLTNREVLNQLKASNAQEKKDRRDTSADFDKILKAESSAAETDPGTRYGAGEGSLLSEFSNLTWKKILVEEYKKLREEPPPYESLDSSIPDQIRVERATVKNSNQDNDIERSGDETKQAADAEITVLLTEWTNADPIEIKRVFENQRQKERTEIPGVPRWIKEEYDFKGYDAQNPDHWEHKAATADDEDAKVLPYTRFAYETAQDDQTPLFELLAGEGGAWVWRHDDGRRRDYFVGDTKVLQYFLKPFEEDAEPDSSQRRTIVGKQWVSKDVLQKSGYEFKEYGEGSYSIVGRLTTAEVRQLHQAASKRTEELLYGLATRTFKPKAISQEGKPKAVALFSFPASETDDLAFESGDILTLEGNLKAQDQWWAASLNGKKGLIPASYVRVLEDFESEEQASKASGSSSHDQDREPQRPNPLGDQGGRSTSYGSSVYTGAGATDDRKRSWYDRFKARFDRKTKEKKSNM